MRALGNILWHFPFLGFINAILTYLLGLLLTATVVAAPLGLGLLELGTFYLSPFGKEMVRSSDPEQKAGGGPWAAYPAVVMILWLPIGAILAFFMIMQVVALFVSIIGIPAAIAVAKAIGTVFNPVGKKCVSVDVAAEMRRRTAQHELAGYNHVIAPPDETISLAPVPQQQASDVPRITPQPVLSAASSEHEERPRASPEKMEKRQKIIRQLGLGLAIGLPLAGLVILAPKAYIAARGMLTSISSTPDQTIKAGQPQAPQNPTPSQTLADTSAQPALPPTPQAMARLSGHAKIHDTATINIGGRTLHLTGLQPVERPEAKAAAQGYLDQAGDLECAIDGTAGWRCSVAAKGIDLAEVFVLSGFAKAAGDAPKALRDAERVAQKNHRGVWGM